MVLAIVVNIVICLCPQSKVIIFTISGGQVLKIIVLQIFVPVVSVFLSNIWFLGKVG
jgi:hypothetical protein